MTRQMTLSPQAANGSHLASKLEPALRCACPGLGKLRWFSTDWQRGGAGTAYSTHPGPNGDSVEVVVKAPVGPRELRFLVALSAFESPTPRVLAHGEAINGYDLAWLVMERIPGRPLDAVQGKTTVQSIATAAAAFHHHANAIESLPPELPPVVDWEHLFDRARTIVRERKLPESQRWNDVLKQAQRAIGTLLPAWEQRDARMWRHGDLHPGNAMCRDEDSPFGPAGCVLLDLAEVRPGHWVEDAIDLERLYWTQPELLRTAKPVSFMARARRDAGLPTDDDYAHLAQIRRVLLGATAPLRFRFERSVEHLHAALEVLSRTLPLLA